MLSMVSGSVGLRAEPARRPHLLLRAGCARSPRRSSRTPRASRSRRRPDALRVRALLLLSPACSSRSAGCPASSSRMKKYGARSDGAHTRTPRPARAAPIPARRADGRPRRSGPLARVASTGAGRRRCAWAGAGLALCAIAAAIVVYMAVKGLQYLQPEPAVPATRPASSTRRKSRRLPGPAHRHVPADRHRHRDRRRRSAVGDRGLARRVRPARAGWRARSSPASRSSPARPTSCSRSSAWRSSSTGFFGFLSFTAEGGAVFGRSFLTAGAMMSLIALPLVVGATREGAAGDPAPRARGVLRARQDARATIRRVLLPAVAAEHRDRRGARHGPDRRRHRDRRDPARRDAAAPEQRRARSPASTCSRAPARR